MELTKNFTPEQFEQGLESWHWIGLEGKTPVLASLFGDVLLTAEAAHRGLSLTADQMYDFTRPPVLGGEMSPDNLGVIDFVVGLNIAGQIHHQVRDLPPGTPVTGVTIS